MSTFSILQALHRAYGRVFFAQAGETRMDQIRRIYGSWAKTGLNCLVVFLEHDLYFRRNIGNGTIIPIDVHIFQRVFPQPPTSECSPTKSMQSQGYSNSMGSSSVKIQSLIPANPSWDFFHCVHVLALRWDHE